MALLLLAVAGCGTAGGASGEGAAARERPAIAEGDLLGRSYSSVSVTVDGEPFPLLKGTTLTIDFHLNGSVRAQAGCNLTDGDLAGQRLDFTGGWTDMACRDGRHQQDRWIGDVLTARPALRLDGTRLTLATAGTTIVLREATPPNRPLAGTRWSVGAFFADDELSKTRPAPHTELVFGPDEVEVHSSCGTGTVGYAADGETLTFGEPVRTDPGCGGAPETALYDVLRDEVRYVAQELIALRHPSGAGIDGYEITAR